MPRRPGRLFRWLSLTARVLLGVFVLWQVVFLFGFNFFALEEERRYGERLRSQIKKRKLQDSWQWTLLSSPPSLGTLSAPAGLVVDWVDNEKQSHLSRALERLKKTTRWYARRTGQEQAWSLFAPNTADWSSFPAVEFRWYDDPEPLRPEKGGLAPLALAGGPALLPRDMARAPGPVRLIWLSANEPADRRCFVRWGGYRIRRFETALETCLRQQGTHEETMSEWEEAIRNRVHRERYEIAVFLRWKLRQLRAQHPDWPPPRQVILRMRTFSIPDPPGPRPWDWTLESDEPMARWRPEHSQEAGNQVEIYLHTQGRFEH
jgi:hypothetical protein